MRLKIISSIVVSLFVAAPAAAQQFQFGLRPEDQAIGYFTYEAEPGAVIEDAVLAVNDSDTEVTLLVQPVNAGVALNGGMAFDMQDAGTGAAAWIEMPDAGMVTVPPKKAMRLPFALRVPAAAAPGEHVAGFLAVIADPEQAAITGDSGAMNVQVIQQSAVSLIVTVPGALRRNMEIAAIDAGFDQDNWRLQIGLANTGNVHFRGSGHVAVTGPDGALVVEQDFNIGYVIPGGMLVYPLYTDAPPPGEYLVEVALTSEQGTQPLASRIESVHVAPPATEENGIQVPVSVAPPSMSAPEPAPIVAPEPQGQDEASEPFVVEPWALIAFVLGVLALVVVGVAFVRINRQRMLETPKPDEQTAVSDRTPVTEST